MKEILLFFICTSFAYSQSIRLISPNGGENWAAGTQYEIKWESGGVSNLRIEISSDNGNTWETITSAYPAFTGSYFWSPGNIKSNHAVIKITDAGNNLISDTSDSTFSITSLLNENQSNNLFNDSTDLNTFGILSGLSITVPNGGEAWRFGSIPEITWNVGAGNTTVKLEFSTDGGSTWTVITNSTDNDGSYLWETMPNVQTSNAIIRITGNGTSETDVSNASFTINSITLPSFSSTVKILPLGNSITMDYNGGKDFPNPRPLGDRKSYRSELYSDLTTNNYNFDFSGGEDGGYNYFDDFQCAGIPGATANQLNSLLQTGYSNKTEFQQAPGAYLAAYPADIVLIHAGTNSPTVGSTSADISNILDKIFTANSNAWVILALIIQTNPVSNDISIFNDNVRIMANNRINTSGDKIILVNMENLLDPNTDYQSGDGVHPDESGYDKMGDAFFTSLQKILGTSSNHAPTIKSIAKTNGVVGVQYTYDVSATGSPAPAYSLVTVPSGMSINSTTGVITWTPSYIGSYNVQVQASSNTQGSDNQSFTINVVQHLSAMTHYWKFEQLYGFPYNDSYGTNDGQEFRYPPSSSITNGIVGNSQDFDENEDIDGETNIGNRITIRDDDSFDWTSTQSFSIELWVRLDVLSGESVLIGRGLASSTSIKWWVSITSDGRAKFVLRDINGNGSDVQTNAGTIVTGNWYHITAVRDESQDKNLIYVNAGTPSSVIHDYTAGFSAADLPIIIGNLRGSTSTDRSSTNTFDGKIDEVAFYNKALSAAEISQDYNNGLAGKGYEENSVAAMVKVFLQGPYNSGSMSTALQTNGYVPTSQPYNTTPWNYDGTETVPSVPTGVVDWVLVQLRTAVTPGDPSTATNIVAQRAAFLMSDGSIDDIDGSDHVNFTGISSGSYYIVVMHRNHLAVMSASAESLPNASAYDFTDSQTKAYTTGVGINPMANLGGEYGMYSGDANSDGSPDAFDNNLYWKPANGQPYDYSTTGRSDYNLDGGIDAFDSNLYWGPNNGKATQVPN